MVGDVSLGVLVDVRADQPDFAVSEVGVSLAESDASVAQRLNLGSGQLQAGLVAVEQVVVVPRTAVVRDQLLAVPRHHEEDTCPTVHYAVVSLALVDRSQLLRGTLDAAALAVVAEQDGYGYDVLRRLRAAGLTDVGDASVYGTLRRLYRAGALTSYVEPSDEGPHRRYYGITSRGRAQLAEARTAWAEFSQTLSTLLETDVEVTA